MDLLVVGAGPAGMSAAITARRHELSVMLVDDQATPGGQIWRSIESEGSRGQILGSAYTEGRPVAAEFHKSGVIYRPGAQLWKIEPGFRAFISHAQQAESIEAKAIVLATGAQERPVPFPGWTVPGVLTVGAGQILLKSAGQVPTGRIWIAGCGPLPLLYAVQLLRAGVEIAGYLDTTPTGQWRRAVRYLPRALRASGDLLKGLGWISALRNSDTRIIKNVHAIEAIGTDRISSIRYMDKSGQLTSADADLLLVHEGVVPNIHVAASADCKLHWNEAQDCFAPVVDDWGESSVEGLFIAGDSAGIAGAECARLQGELAAHRIAEKLRDTGEREAFWIANPLRRKLRRHLATRPFLDALYKPRPEVFVPADDTIVCRCEEITAKTIREVAAVGQLGPNQLKSATRAGMGPCQGRQCGYTVTRILSAVEGRPPSEVGFYNVRPPLKPITLGELASLSRGVMP